MTSACADDNYLPPCDTVRASTIISPLLCDIGFRGSHDEWLARGARAGVSDNNIPLSHIGFHDSNDEWRTRALSSKQNFTAEKTAKMLM